MEKKCEGNCKNYEEGGCKGEVRTVVVSGHGWKETEFNYCETAIQEDKRRGFSVVLLADVEE